MIAFPDLISTPPTANNYGAISPASPIAVASPTTLALLTLDIAPQASATNPSYVLSSI